MRETKESTAGRTANHLAMALNTYSGTVHAAADLNGRGAPLHVLACNGRALSAAAWDGGAAEVTCGVCRKGIASGRIVWAGR